MLNSTIRAHQTAPDQVGIRSKLPTNSAEEPEDLSVGANIASCKALRSNVPLSNRGVIPHGSGFVLTPEEAESLGFGTVSGLEKRLPRYINGRDVTQTPRDVRVIDLFPLTEEESRQHHPELYQWLVTRVKPERDQNKRKSVRERWWIFAEPRKVMRAVHADLDRFIATVQVSKHRFFVFVNKEVLPDDKVIAIGLESGAALGVLTSRIHVHWSFASGARMGVGNDPVYNKSSCFDAFPFPAVRGTAMDQLSQIAEHLDVHRKRQQEQHPGLTMTGMYNVLEKLRREEPLTPKEKEIHEQGLVSVLRELHDDLDRAVFAAYGWEDLAEKLVGRPGATTPWPEKPEEQQEAEEELLQRLVDLNHQRAAEEAQGKIRWLRPEYQAPDQAPEQAELETTDKKTAASSHPDASSHSGGSRHPGLDPGTSTKKQPWPKTLQAQIRAVRDQLQTAPMDVATLASQYKRKPEKSVAQVLAALHELGMVAQGDEGQYRLKEG